MRFPGSSNTAKLRYPAWSSDVEGLHRVSQGALESLIEARLEEEHGSGLRQATPATDG